MTRPSRGPAAGRALPDATTVILPGAGHLMMIEQPDPVIDTLAASCDRTPPAGHVRRIRPDDGPPSVKSGSGRCKPIRPPSDRPTNAKPTVHPNRGIPGRPPPQPATIRRCSSPKRHDQLVGLAGAFRIERQAAVAAHDRNVGRPRLPRVRPRQNADRTRSSRGRSKPTPTNSGCGSLPATTSPGISTRAAGSSTPAESSRCRLTRN